MTTRLMGMTWWIDRWRKSTAFTDMTLEEQGAYRNLLDECWLRGGALPLDDRAIAKASGDARRWPKVRAVVMRRFQKHEDGWHNETLDQVLRRTTARADRQRVWRAATGNPVAETDDERRARNNARMTVHRAIREGQLQRLPCDVCGAVPTQAHHDDYSKPLEVRWLCRAHHDEFHYVIRPQRRDVRIT